MEIKGQEENKMARVKTARITRKKQKCKTENNKTSSSSSARQ